MSFKSVLVHVRADTEYASLIRAAVGFAYDCQADLIGLGARAPIFVEDPGFGYLDQTAVQAIVDREEADLTAAQKRFSEIAHPLGERAHWRILREFPNDAVARAAAGADIILAAIETAPHSSGFALNLPALVCEAGLPVLAIPQGFEPLRSRSVLVAWRNTREARRALTCALPLLKNAREVHLLQVAADQDAAQAWVGLRDAAERLARHGVTSICNVRPGIKNAAATLLEGAMDAQADLIVLGGYGHSRAREWVWGGVTRDLFATTPLPLLLAH